MTTRGRGNHAAFGREETTGRRNKKKKKSELAARSAYRQIENTSAGMQEGAASPFLCYPQRRRVRRFFRITPWGRLGGPKPSKYNPNPATCAAGSEALRSKVSLRVSPAAPQAQGKRVLAEKAGSAAFSDKLKPPPETVSGGGLLRDNQPTASASPADASSSAGASSAGTSSAATSCGITSSASLVSTGNASIQASSSRENRSFCAA